MWEARCGYFHHASVIPNGAGIPAFAGFFEEWLYVGRYVNLPSFSLDFAYNYIEFHKRNISNSNTATNGMQTENTKTEANIFSLTATHRFGLN